MAAAEACKKWRAKNPDDATARSKAWRAERPGYHANKAREWKYGMEPGQFAQMLLEQDNKCAACGAEFGSSRFEGPNVDHNHETGVVRALLCGGCNSALGYARESASTLRSLAAYVEGW